jgi:hypothetical protein
MKLLIVGEDWMVLTKLLLSQHRLERAEERDRSTAGLAHGKQQCLTFRDWKLSVIRVVCGMIATIRRINKGIL